MAWPSVFFLFFFSSPSFFLFSIWLILLNRPGFSTLFRLCGQIWRHYKGRSDQFSTLSRFCGQNWRQNMREDVISFLRQVKGHGDPPVPGQWLRSCHERRYLIIDLSDCILSHPISTFVVTKAYDYNSIDFYFYFLFLGLGWVGVWGCAGVGRGVRGGVGGWGGWGREGFVIQPMPNNFCIHFFGLNCWTSNYAIQAMI